MKQQRMAHGAGKAGGELIILLAILAIFAALALWIISRIQADYEQLPAYSTFSTEPDGTRALWLLCQEAGLTPSQHFESEYDYPLGTAMVVLHEDGLDAGAWLFDPFDVSAVLDWVEQGNCLVVCTPAGSMLATALEEELGSSTGGSYTADPRVCGKYVQAGQTGQTTAMWRVYQPGQQYELPADAPALWSGIKQFETAGSSGLSLMEADVLLATSTPPEPAVLHFTRGQGEVLWLARPEMATNHWLGRAGNAQVMWALLSYASRYGPVYFDENIHGYQRPHKSAVQMIFTTPGGWLLLAGLASVLLLLLGRAVLPARIVVRPVPPRRDSTEMVLAQADLFRRAQVTGLIGRSLLDSYRRAFQRVLREGQPLDESAFRELLERLRVKSGGGRLTVAHYISTGAVPRRPAELLSFGQELGSLLEHARQSQGWTADRRRIQ
jgi:hypothetical protein